jgi:outer membrane receptor protein involved in Fe transport
MKRWILRLTSALAAIAVAASATVASAQVTTGSIRGLVTDSENRPLEGARITAIHLPSGTQYVGATRADGRFNIPGMRVGGPYSVSAAMIGYARQNRDDIQVSLGSAADLVFKMDQVATQLNAVTVTSEGGELSSTRTGAATSIRQEQLATLPTISRRLSDFTRLTPQASGNSFAGQDNRLNNITVDGAAFNNSFGLGGQPGDRTGVAPISLDAIEAVQVNIAPFDVRQSGFTGAAVNTVTRSGTNEFSGSIYYNVRDQEYVGRQAGRNVFNPGTFSFDQIGFRLGGPILKDKLFFFVSYETDEFEGPGNTNLPRDASQTAGGNITRVLRTDLDSMSTFLLNRFGYVTGRYEGYPGATPSNRLTTRVDFALSQRNKFSFRYTNLGSETDVLVSTSSSLTNGLIGRTRNNAMSFENSNYTILENIDSYAAEWNSLLTDRMSNQLIVTYTKQDESRGAITNLFPFVDVLAGDISASDNSVYMSFGSEPFTPNNELRYNNLQVQNNFTRFGNRHDLTLGVAYERYESENVFYPGSQSSYTYNSLSDFYADANAFFTACGSNPANWGTCTPPTTSAAGVGPRTFTVRYMNIPGLSKPVQPLEVNTFGAYIQDEWRVRNNLTVTAGLRADIISFGNTAFENDSVANMRFLDENGDSVRYNTGALPPSTPLFSPRLGFNYDVRGNGQTVVRGGSGIFTGRPAYVWISNQIGNNGVLTGTILETAAAGTSLGSRPFDPRPTRYVPTGPVTGAPALQYQLALTDKDFKFPQVWRTNLAVDHRFKSGWRGTVEFIWGQDVNGIYYINANQPESDGNFTGPDARERWFTDKCATFDPDGAGPTPAFYTQIETNRINCAVQDAIVLKNQNVGRSYNAAVSLERNFTNGFFVKGAMAYGDARNTVDPGSIASGSFFGNPHRNNPNDPGVGLSGAFQGRRSFLVASHTRDWFGFGNTTISTFLENFTLGNTSYLFGGDLNGDGGTNDLIWVPENQSQMNFAQQTFTSGTFRGTACSSGTPCVYTPAQQAADWDAYINQDPYLRSRRGQYAERGGLILPTVTRMDLSVSQDLSALIAGKKNSLQVRLDILNFTNMINSDWGLAKFVVNNQPLIPRNFQTTGSVGGVPCSTASPCNGPADNLGRPIYTYRVISGQPLSRTFQKSANTADVWRMQLGLRYTFN